MFERDAYEVVCQLLDQETSRLVANYAKAKHVLGQTRPGDKRVENAPNLYCDPLTEVLLLDRQRHVERITALSLVPSFSYLRLHFAGAALPEHTDRPGAEIAVTINLGGDCPWPLWLRIDGTPTQFELGVGDALVFRGGRLPHWREPYPGKHHVQVMLCYVDEAGICSADRPAGHPLSPVIDR